MQNPPFEQQGLHVMSKPIGPICNLDCEYCYYLHKEELYPRGERWKMPEETLEEYICQYMAAQPALANEITFAWQGGEPTLLGIDFFKRVVELQQRHVPRGKRIVNSLQTNGVLLDDDWCEFLKTNDFLVGLSIDGPAEFHDKFRYDKQGNPTFAAVMRGLNLLKKHAIEFNALVVVNRHNGDHGRKIYTYLRDNGVLFMQFIPIVEKVGVGAHAEKAPTQTPLVNTTVPPNAQSNAVPAEPKSSIETDTQHDHLVSSRSVRPQQFGRFLIDVFDVWKTRDVGRVFVQIFDQALSAWMGVEPSLCVFRRECGRAMAIEHNGDLYCCDHFVEPQFHLGNIHQLPIVEMANSEQQREFGRAKSATLPQYCLDCEVRFACNGECPKNRIINTPNGNPGLNYLCAGYRAFFNHIDPAMKLMTRELKQRRPAAGVMPVLRDMQNKKTKPATADSLPPQQRGPASNRSKKPDRNSPCPCGSGRKFKKCCFR